MSIRRRHHDRVVDVIFDNFDDVISVAVSFVIMKISLSLESNNLRILFWIDILDILKLKLGLTLTLLLVPSVATSLMCLDISNMSDFSIFLFNCENELSCYNYYTYVYIHLTIG